MAYELFKIGTNDYTSFLRTQDYNVLINDVTETWVDANYITRASIIRTRISGSVKLVMERAEYNAFMAVLGSVKNADGTYPIQVHANNSATTTATTSANVYATISVNVVYGTPNYQYSPTAMVIVFDFEEA